MALGWICLKVVLMWTSLVLGKPSARYDSNWTSLDSRPLPGWYDEAKFGIIVHWGVYSVPALKDEWFWYHMKNDETTVNDFISNHYPEGFSYEDFVQDFKGQLFNTSNWANIFRVSGARYVVLTSKHHDGYALWPSAWSPGWNSHDTGPHRDIVGELGKAVTRKNMRFGIYYSLLEWFHPKYMADRRSGFVTQDYVDLKMLPELRDLVLSYRPDVIWVDGNWEASNKYFRSADFLAWLYNKSPVKRSVVVNDRWGNDTNDHHGSFYTGVDRLNPKELKKHKWENCLPMDKKSWGYRQGVDISDYVTLSDIIQHLVTTVSSGGNLLLNVAPTKEGTIDRKNQQRLRDVGAWLKVNGAAIYGTTPWIQQNDDVNSNVWYTQSKKTKNTIYLIMLEWPKDDLLEVSGLLHVATVISSISMLGSWGNLTWTISNSVVTVNLERAKIDRNSIAWTLVIRTFNKRDIL